MRSLVSAAVFALGLFAAVAIAQEQQITPDEAKQLESLNQSDRGGQVPGDEVMRPTKHGVRLTPGLARAISGAWIGEMIEKDIGATLDDTQKSRLSETMARRMMEMGHKYGKQVGPFLELSFGHMGRGGIDVKPDQAKEYGRQAKATAPIWREFFGHMVEDCSPYLDAEDLAKVKKKQEQVQRAIDRFEQRMDRWSNGDKKEGERPFEDLNEPEEEQGKDASDGGKAKKTPEARSAENRARFAMRRIEPSNWREFLNNVRDTFKLTDEQYAKGQELLNTYTDRAKEIMTPEWRGKVRRNRILVNMQGALRKESPAPWVHHLEVQYNELTKPLEELEKSFQLEVMGLVTRNQREAVLRDLREFAAKHGMTADEADIRFPTTGPA